MVHIKLNTLLEQTAKKRLIEAYPLLLSNGNFNTPEKKDLLKRQITSMKKTMMKNPEIKRCILDQCKYGIEKAMQLAEERKLTKEQKEVNAISK